MADSSDDEPLLANFMARRPTNSNSSNSSLPEWIKAHQVKLWLAVLRALRCAALRAWRFSLLRIHSPPQPTNQSTTGTQTPQKGDADDGPEPTSSSDAKPLALALAVAKPSKGGCCLVLLLSCEKASSF
jgi:hypothetical protein